LKLESDLNRHIYEYYEARILSGYYHYGDPLPSIHKVSAAFRVSVLTVRVALAALAQQGYVTLDARKVARVAYQIPNTNYQKNAMEYFVPRSGGIVDLTQGGRLLLKPCWDAGLQEWKQKDWPAFQELLQTSLPNDVVAPHVVLYIAALSILQNRLLINLYWEIIHYTRFPFLIKGDNAALYSGVAGHSYHETVLHLNRELEDACNQRVKELFAFIDEAETQLSLEQIHPIPFRWRIYRKQPQLRYSLASHIIRGIMYHQYPVGSQLPSLSKLAELHEISVNTVRRTLSLLEKLGVVESHQGKRATIRMEAVPFDVNEPDIHEGLRLYLDALQIIELTIQPVIFHILETASSDVQESLTETFTNMREQQVSNSCFEVIFAFIYKQSPLAIVQECYSRLLELIAWGFPLVLYRLSGSNLNMQYLDFNIRAEQHLKDRNWIGFSYDWKELITKERQQALAFIAEKSNHSPVWDNILKR